MRMAIAAAALIVAAPLAQAAYAEGVPQWVKSTAGWWADGSISESEFVSAIEHLMREGIMEAPPAAPGAAERQGAGVPEWVKTTAAWWSQGAISDAEFMGGIAHLMGIGVVSVGAPAAQGAPAQEAPAAGDAELGRLEAELAACAGIAKAYDRLNCEDDAEDAITAHAYRTGGTAYEAGPVTFYYRGNGFEVTQSGQAILDLSLLAVNSGGGTVTLSCTGPAICAYDVWDGTKAYKYSGMDFTNGAITLGPGQSREFSMTFGPNIGYGGTTFEHHEGRDYSFRISEPWGSASIPLAVG